MKKQLLAILFAGFTLSAQAQDIPQECRDYLDLMKATAEAKKNAPTKAEIEETIKGAEKEFADAVKLNGKEAVAKGCAELTQMMKEIIQSQKQGK